MNPGDKRVLLKQSRNDVERNGAQLARERRQSDCLGAGTGCGLSAFGLFLVFRFGLPTVRR